jgi:site-specific DNA-methyltransferase (adenine-specific)
MSNETPAASAPVHRVVGLRPYYEEAGITIYHGDSAEILPHLSGIEACVTDPPYGLSFMGKAWDYDVPAVTLWAACLAALKPGAHLLAFAGTRTQHRMAVNIEDAGFEIRDMIAWVYGQGFPKSLNVSKAIESGGRPEDIRRMQMGAEYAPSGRGRVKYDHGAGSAMGATAVSWSPSTDAAKKWNGWGTALKPALEPITLARRPLDGTVAGNVLAHGTGALNIDACRISAGDEKLIVNKLEKWSGFGQKVRPDYAQEANNKGRFPATIVHDGSEEATGLFPGEGDKSAARFFYCAKASKSERGAGNGHPTVKPLDLMRYLVRLVCPPGGIVLDPFMGSGTTLLAARSLGMRAIGIERDEQYCRIAVQRLAQ